MEQKSLKTFRLTPTTLERLKRLAELDELKQTTYLEQLIKREAEKRLKKTSS